MYLMSVLWSRKCNSKSLLGHLLVMVLQTVPAEGCLPIAPHDGTWTVVDRQKRKTGPLSPPQLAGGPEGGLRQARGVLPVMRRKTLVK